MRDALKWPVKGAFIGCFLCVCNREAYIRIISHTQSISPICYHETANVIDCYSVCRFLPERKAARHAMAYLPFGSGPRVCVGQRFAVYEIKMALLQLVRRYKFQQCPETQIPLPLKVDGVRAPLKGNYLKVKQREAWDQMERGRTQQVMLQSHCTLIESLFPLEHVNKLVSKCSRDN